jgi:UPF0755 protein
MKMGKRKSGNRFAFLGIAIMVISILAILGYRYYNYLYKHPYPTSEDDVILYIPTGSGFDDVIDSLKVNSLINNEKAFRWVAGVKKYTENVKAGRYRVPRNLNNDDLVDLLRSGRQEPVRLVIQEVRTLDELAGLLSSRLEPTTADFQLAFLSAGEYGDPPLNDTTFLSMFIANTYEVFWNVTTDALMDRMYSEYERFWNRERTKLAEEAGLNATEVYTLASIVYAETKKVDEAPVVAGLYMNRLSRGMPLESDPTLIFSKGDFSIRRVLNKDKEIDSPFNTYRNKGLPPGPINMPPYAWIDAVLNYDRNNYIFMCAREDFSGYHNFATNYSEHERKAASYRRALNRRGIYR